jgi:hypothetical protein
METKKEVSAEVSEEPPKYKKHIFRRGLAAMKVYVDSMVERNVPFVLYISNKSYSLFGEMNFYFTDSKLTPKALHLIKAVRKYVKENNIGALYPKKTPHQLGTKYMRFEPRYFGKKGIGLVEIDVDKAYWATMLKLRIISQELYERGLLVSKIGRLAAAGTLGRTIRKRIYNGWKYTKTTVHEKSKDTRHLWDLTGFKVDELMQKCMKAQRSEFMFYWTDAMFIPATVANLKRVKRTIEENGYFCKIVENVWYEYRKDAVYIFSLEKGRDLKEEELPTLNLDWVKRNIDLSRIMAMPARKIVSKKKKKSISSSRILKDTIIDPNQIEAPVNHGEEWDYEKIVFNANNKPLSVEDNLKRAKLTGVSDEALLKKLHQRLYVRNFCYSIDNKRLWKRSRKKVSNKFKKPKIKITRIGDK